MTETWKKVPGWESYYEVSDIGGVRSKDRIVECAGRDGKLRTQRYYGRVLKHNVNGRGYHSVLLICQTTQVRSLVARLMLAAFVGRCPEGMEACHNDGDPHNNCLSNLRWDTPAGNAADKLIHGTAGIGEGNPRARLTVEMVRKIRASRSLVRETAEAYGVSCSAVIHIRNRRTWRHVA